MRAIKALVRASPAEALEPLISAIDDRSPSVRVIAAYALDDVDDTAAVPAMEAAKRRTWNPYVRPALRLNIVRLRASRAA